MTNISIFDKWCQMSLVLRILGLDEDFYSVSIPLGATINKANS
jgi:Na+/serine symporter